MIVCGQGFRSLRAGAFRGLELWVLELRVRGLRVSQPGGFRS